MSLASEQYSFIMNKQDPSCVKYCSENHGHTSTVLKLPGFHDQTIIPWWAGRDLVLNQRCGCCHYVLEFAGGKFQCYRRDLKSPVYVEGHVGYKSHVVMKPLNVCKSIDQMYSTACLILSHSRPMALGCPWCTRAGLKMNLVSSRCAAHALHPRYPEMPGSTVLSADGLAWRFASQADSRLSCIPSWWRLSIPLSSGSSTVLRDT